MIYIDNYEGWFKGKKYCHMIADSTEELVAFAKRLGLKEQWIQNRGKGNEHFDVVWSKRDTALLYGAKELTAYELATITFERLRMQNKIKQEEL